MDKLMNNEASQALIESIILDEYQSEIEMKKW